MFVLFILHPNGIVTTKLDKRKVPFHYFTKTKDPHEYKILAINKQIKRKKKNESGEVPVMTTLERPLPWIRLMCLPPNLSLPLPYEGSGSIMGHSSASYLFYTTINYF